MFAVGITEFAKRQLKSDFGGTRLTPEQLEECARLCELSLAFGGVKDGYAPFCKLVTLAASAILGVLCPIVEVTPENEHLLRTEYRARRDGELPVLVRYFTGITRGPAHHFNVVLYSREQLEAEAKATSSNEVINGDWGIVAVNAEPGKLDSPIPPVTIMRNALGKEEGGSGVALDRANYLESVAYWSKYAQTE